VQKPSPQSLQRHCPSSLSNEVLPGGSQERCKWRPPASGRSCHPWFLLRPARRGHGRGRVGVASRGARGVAGHSGRAVLGSKASAVENLKQEKDAILEASAFSLEVAAKGSNVLRLARRRMARQGLKSSYPVPSQVQRLNKAPNPQCAPPPPLPAHSHLRLPTRTPAARENLDSLRRERNRQTRPYTHETHLHCELPSRAWLRADEGTPPPTGSGRSPAVPAAGAGGRPIPHRVRSPPHGAARPPVSAREEGERRRRRLRLH
jgi:hypothetical protein